MPHYSTLYALHHATQHDAALHYTTPCASGFSMLLSCAYGGRGCTAHRCCVLPVDHLSYPPLCCLSLSCLPSTTRCLVTLDTRSSGVSRADQRGMSKTASVSFVKVHPRAMRPFVYSTLLATLSLPCPSSSRQVRKRIAALNTTYASALTAFKASPAATAPEEVGRRVLWFPVVWCGMRTTPHHSNPPPRGRDPSPPRALHSGFDWALVTTC